MPDPITLTPELEAMLNAVAIAAQACGDTEKWGEAYMRVGDSPDGSIPENHWPALVCSAVLAEIEKRVATAIKNNEASRFLCHDVDAYYRDEEPRP